MTYPVQPLRILIVTCNPVLRLFFSPLRVCSPGGRHTIFHSVFRLALLVTAPFVHEILTDVHRVVLIFNLTFSVFPSHLIASLRCS